MLFSSGVRVLVECVQGLEKCQRVARVVHGLGHALADQVEGDLVGLDDPVVGPGIGP